MIGRPLEPPRGLDGLPVAGPREERAALAVAVVASLWFVLAAAWEIAGPLLAGHYASSASVGIIAENMLRWHIPGPVWEYTQSRPPPSMYYCHHPWGIFWTTAALMKLFGRHDFICRLAPVLLSAATPPLLFALGRAIWRPAAGAAAAAAFVVLPISLGFANHNGLEVPVIAWTLLGLWGFVRMTQTGRRRYLAASLAGTLLALHADWPAYVSAGVMLGFALLRGFVAPGLFGPLRHTRRYMQWWAFAASGAVLTFALYVAVFRDAGKLDDLLGAYGMRSSGNAVPLSAVLESRRYWIELCFSPIAIALGKAAAWVIALRLLILRREHEVVPLAVLLMAVVQYVVFKQGADIHVFWPHYFAAYFALAMGALVATLAPLLGWIRPLGGRAPEIALGAALIPVLGIARDGVPALRYARDTGGRFNEKGLLIHSDGAKTAFLRSLDSGPAALPRSGLTAFHDGMKLTWSHVWTLGGRVVVDHRNAPGHARNNVWLADTRFLLNDQQGAVAKDHHVTAVGPFWKVSEGDPAAPLDAFSFAEREPSWWEWYLLSGTEPHRDIVPDPWLTWELRTHFGQPADAPTGAPVTFDQQRIAHTLAVATGDAARAAELYAEIERRLAPLHAAYEDGTEMVGSTFHDGARPLLTLLIKAGGPTSADVQLTVRSKVTEKAAWSLTVADPADREVGVPLLDRAPALEEGLSLRRPHSRPQAPRDRGLPRPVLGARRRRPAPTRGGRGPRGRGAHPAVTHGGPALGRNPRGPRSQRGRRRRRAPVRAGAGLPRLPPDAGGHGGDRGSSRRRVAPLAAARLGDRGGSHPRVRRQGLVRERGPSSPLLRPLVRRPAARGPPASDRGQALPRRVAPPFVPRARARRAPPRSGAILAVEESALPGLRRPGAPRRGPCRGGADRLATRRGRRRALPRRPGARPARRRARLPAPHRGAGPPAADVHGGREPLARGHDRARRHRLGRGSAARGSAAPPYAERAQGRGRLSPPARRCAGARQRDADPPPPLADRRRRLGGAVPRGQRAPTRRAPTRAARGAPRRGLAGGEAALGSRARPPSSPRDGDHPAGDAGGSRRPGPRQDQRRALARLGRRDVGPLLAALEDPDGEIRSAAARELGETGDPSVLGGLLRHLEQDTPEVQVATAWALGQLGDAAALPGLHAALLRGGRVARAAASALIALRDERSVEPLLGALAHPDWFVHDMALEVVGKLRSPRSVTPLIAALGHRFRQTRAAVAEALGAVGDRRAVAPLLAALEREDDLAPAVITALGAIGDPSVLPRLEALAQGKWVWYAERAIQRIREAASPA